MRQVQTPKGARIFPNGGGLRPRSRASRVPHAIVAGASSRIGKAIALKLASHGADLWLGGRHDSLPEASKRLPARPVSAGRSAGRADYT